jgi:hypothetical protein
MPFFHVPFVVPEGNGVAVFMGDGVLDGAGNRAVSMRGRLDGIGVLVENRSNRIQAGVRESGQQRHCYDKSYGLQATHTNKNRAFTRKKSY